MTNHHKSVCIYLTIILIFGFAASESVGETADLIFLGGEIVTVDPSFSIARAFAVRRDRILIVGTDEDVLKTRGPNTKVVDLAGATVLPGLIDSHTHPTPASLIEFDHQVPAMETIADVLEYVKTRAKALGAGKWVVIRQVFITRLKEQRYPTKAELDRAAPGNPVVFATGPDASVNSLALKLSGIDRTYRIDGPGKIEREAATGEPTGILRNCTRLMKIEPAEREPNESEIERRLIELFRDYHSVGLTAVIDRDAKRADVDRYRRLHAAGAVQIRLGISVDVETQGSIESIRQEIRRIAADPLVQGDASLRIIGIKTFLDGGMLTGSAYMSAPWGVSKIYAIDDPEYRGELFIRHDRLVAIVRSAVEAGLQFTAHSVGDGAVSALLDAYAEVNQTIPIQKTRPCVTHSNFMSRELIDRAARLGVVVDIQPAWLYLDTKTLVAHFGVDRLRYFQPLKSLFEAKVIVGGGSDHMQKIGSLRSINPYNPFLGMWIAITRSARGYDGPLHPEQKCTREQAIKMYTINNAKLLFLEDRIGSIEAGKLADFAIIDRDILACNEDQIKEIQVKQVYLGGAPIFTRP
jgi:predicted amidohydrolase YtcJ